MSKFENTSKEGFKNEREIFDIKEWGWDEGTLLDNI